MPVLFHTFALLLKRTMDTKKVSGIVVRGNRIGRTLGFPTANLDCGDGIDMPEGVYAVKVSIGDGTLYEGMANFGKRPSVGGAVSANVLEVNVFGYDGELYGKRMEVEFVEFIRPEQKFASLEDLKAAIADDRLNVEKYFKEK